MELFILAVDFATLSAALASGILWWQASRRRLRRVSRHEELNSADLNRIIVALNRAQILNSRAAKTTAVAALFAGTSMMLHLIFQ